MYSIIALSFSTPAMTSTRVCLSEIKWMKRHNSRVLGRP